MLAELPEQLWDAETVGVIYDEVEGLNFYGDFGRLEALFADPALMRRPDLPRGAARLSA